MITATDGIKKPAMSDHAEHRLDDVEGKMVTPRVEVTDYAGAAKVTDPAELRLVRKLDFRIMVWRDPNPPCFY